MLTYGDFQDHSFFVCLACTQRDRVLRPAAYLAIGAIALVLVIALIARTASVFAILAVFVAAAGLVGLVMQTSLRSKLERLAFRERGGNALNGYIIVDPRMRPR